MPGPLLLRVAPSESPYRNLSDTGNAAPRRALCRGSLYDAPVAAPGSPVKSQIPRWIQLVALPLILLFLWVVAGHIKHVIFLFLIASLVALLLNALVRRVARYAHLPRGVAIFVVYIAFLVALFAALGGIGTVIVDQTRTAGQRLDAYVSNVQTPPGQVGADQDIDRLQAWLDNRGLSIDVKTRGHKLVEQARKKDIGKYTRKAVNFLEGAAVSIGRTLFDFVLLVVISIYMLIDLPRLASVLERRFPTRRGTRTLLGRIEHTLAAYVKGQLLLSLIIGGSAGLFLWIFDLLGLLPGVGTYVLLFAAFVALTELIPYIGPWIGGVPPFIYALFVKPLSAVWVVLLFLFIHQVEGHVVVPNVMGRAVRLHPLLVIFGLLGGLELYGLPGALVVLPLAASGRAVYEFFSERVELEPWEGGSGPIPVEVEAPPQPPAPPTVDD